MRPSSWDRAREARDTSLLWRDRTGLRPYSSSLRGASTNAGSMSTSTLAERSIDPVGLICVVPGIGGEVMAEGRRVSGNSSSKRLIIPSRVWSRNRRRTAIRT